MNYPTTRSPAYALYGEGRIFPDVLHCETITTRASLHDWKIARHRHPDLHQFFLIQTGGVTLRLPSGDRRLTPPVVISMPCQTEHGFLFSAGTEGFVVSVPQSVLAPLAGHGLHLLHIAPATDRIADLILAIAGRHAGSGGTRDIALAALAVALGCDCIPPRNSPADTDPATRLFARFEDAVRAHATEGWTVARYAAALATSPTQLNRTVRAQADTSVMGAVRTHLLGMAARRLAYTRQPITTIAYELGFSDPTYFARVFRKGLGMSPRAYRQQFG